MATIGQRSKFLEVFRDTTQQDYVHSSTSPTRIAKTWGRVRPASGREVEQARTMERQISGVIEMPYEFVNIKATDYVMMDGRRLNIVAVIDPDESKKMLQVQYVEPT